MKNLNLENLTPLGGHVDEASAYVVNDYPYGFRLRCKIRYWLEHSLKKGTRFCSQTTNPKVNAFQVGGAGKVYASLAEATKVEAKLRAADGIFRAVERVDVWNKPKKFTYADICGAMFLDAQNHVAWVGVGYYSELFELIEFQMKFSTSLPADMAEHLAKWVTTKTNFERARADGFTPSESVVIGRAVCAGQDYATVRELVQSRRNLSPEPATTS